MTLQQALEASAVNSAVFGGCEDIIYRGYDNKVLMWLQTSYRVRERALRPSILESNDWYPIQPLAGKVKKADDAN